MANEASSRTFDFYPLEQRILLDGEGIDAAEVGPDADLVAELMAELELADAQVVRDPNAIVNVSAEQPAETADFELSAPTVDPALPLEVVFVDAGVEDFQTLLDGLRDGDEQTQWLIVELAADADGIEQITDALSELQGVDAIHILSHGGDGNVGLGNTWLNASTIGGYAGRIAGWQDALTGDADVLFYGCELAQSERGQDLIDSISVLTGADVAASDDDTGHAALGGDWELEYQTGEVETAVAFGAAAIDQWLYVLPDTTPPEISSIETADLNSDGFIDAIHVTFSEAIDDSTVIANDWDVAGVTGEAFSSTTNGDTANDSDIYITFADGVLDTAATPDVTYAQDSPTDVDLADLAGNKLDDYASWWDTNWLNRTKITFDNTNSAENLTDFPVLISLNSSKVDFSKIKAGGADIRFVDDDGTLLNYEIESWDDGAETATIWVKVQQLDTASSTDFIHLYYNNAAASDAQNAAGVWDTNDHVGVWHLDDVVTDEQTSGTHTDSTGVHDGSQVNNDDYTGEGRHAQTFDGSNDYIRVADHDDFTFASGGDDTAFSLSAWVQGETGDGYIASKYRDSTGGWDFFVDGGLLWFAVSEPGGSDWIGRTTTASLTGGWQHVMATYDGSETDAGITIYIDGVQQATTTYNGGSYNGMTDSTTAVDFGVYNGGGNSYDFNGEMDEVRISSAERSADWIEASYLSQNGAFAFTSFGGEQAATSDNAGPVILAKETTDLNGDGFIDAIRVTYSEAISDATVNAGDWDVTGVAGEAFSSTTAGDVANDNDIYITFDDGVLDTGATPDLVYTQNATADLNGNLLAGSDTQSWWDSDWQSRTKITFDNTNSAANLTDFPVLISLDSSNVDFSKIQAGGADVRFVDDDGTLLDYEIADWDDGAETASVWVRVQQLDSGSSTDFIHIYYNNASASDAQNAAGVWDANHVGVWHLDESGSGAADEFADSSGTGNHGQGGAGDSNNTPTQTTGAGAQIDNAQSFDGSNDLIDIDNAASLGITTDITISAWIKRDVTNDYDMILAKAGSGPDYWDYSFYFASGGNDLRFWADGTSSTVVSSGTTITDTAWHHVAVTRSGGTVTFYIDGVATSGGESMTGAFNNNSDPLVIGDDPSSQNGWWDGNLDEVRLSNATRSADWIEASYLSQNGSFAFANFGSEQVATTDKAGPAAMSLTMSDSALKVGETSTLTVTFSEAVTGFDNSDLTIENGTLTAVSSGDGGVTWTATYTPTDDLEDTSNVISVGTGLTDNLSNAASTGGSTANYTIDTKEPVISSVTLSDSALKVGETATLTITFSEAVSGFDNSDITVENGTITSVSSGDGGVTWTATFTPTDDLEDATNVISVGTVLTDAAGNAPVSSANSANYTIDTKEPVISSVTLSDSALKVGETATLTITFSEAVSGFDNSDITVENGTLTAVSSSDGGVTWTATFTPTDDLEDATNVISVGTVLTDAAGNAPVSGSSSANYTIDTKEPVISSVTLSDSALKVGETATLTITFSEAVSGFDNSDITVENGTITAISSGDGGVTWTATFTPTDDLEDATNVISVGTSLTDAAGNAPVSSANSANYTIDTREPVISSVTLSDSALKVGETATLTITFSEAVSGFDNSDITVENGTLTAVSSGDGGVTWTATFTPTDDLEDASNVISVGTVLTDAAGNAPVSGTNSANYTIDTKEPVISSVTLSDTALKVGETATLTITFSEAVSGFDNSDITVENGTITTVSSGDGGVTWTATYTPTDDLEDATNVISVGTVLTDAAGNAPVSGANSANYSIDTKEPLISSVTLSDSALKVGETATLTVTFSEAVSGFDNSDITVENGTITAVSSGDGGVTWTATFTPTDDLEDATNVISVGTVLTDAAGNAPVSGTNSANYTIDTKEPVISSVTLSDTALKVGETATLTITFSEAVSGFDNSDITVENGTITAVTSGDGGVTWTATYTPTDDLEDATNVISVGTVLTDSAGNAPVSGANSANYTIDTKEPVISSVTLSDSALKVGETATLTITFSEAVSGFDNSDITVENGTITAVSSGDGGVTWTATFTPTDDLEDATNVISVGTVLTDAAGNAPLTGGATANYAIDTKEPTVISRTTADLDGDGFIDAIHITFSEAIDDSSIVANDWDVAGVTGEAFSSTTNGDTANDADIYITFADGVLDTGATPTISYTQDGPTDVDVTDVAGNELANIVAATTTDNAGPVLMSAVGTDVGSGGMFDEVGDYLELVFSETIAAAPSEADSEINFLFVGFDGDNLPTEIGGDSIIQLMTTTVANDTIRYTFSTGDTPSGNPFDPAIATIDVNLAGLIADSIEDLAGNDLVGTATGSPLSMVNVPVGAITDSDAGADEIDENSANGTAIGITAQAIDPSPSDTVTYSLDDNAGGRFAIHASTGQVTVADGSLLNHEDQASHNITVRASSSDGSSTTQSYVVNVNDINEAPTATADSYSVNAESTLTVSADGVITNDGDVDGDTITTILVTPPSHGSLVLQADGSLTYTPDSGFAGNDSFFYRVTDGVLQSNIVEVQVAVLGAPPPVDPDSAPEEEAEEETDPEAEAETEPETEPELELDTSTLTDEAIDSESESSTSTDVVESDAADATLLEQLNSLLIKNALQDAQPQLDEVGEQEEQATEMNMVVDSESSVERSPTRSAAETRIAEQMLRRDIDQSIVWHAWKPSTEYAQESSMTVVVGSAVGATGALSFGVGYTMVWAMRGGAVMTAISTGLPTWRIIDPAAMLSAYHSSGGPGIDRVERMLSSRLGG